MIPDLVRSSVLAGLCASSCSSVTGDRKHDLLWHTLSGCLKRAGDSVPMMN